MLSPHLEKPSARKKVASTAISSIQNNTEVLKVDIDTDLRKIRE